jgi:phosphoesterase RecJ-like protein
VKKKTSREGTFLRAFEEIASLFESGEKFLILGHVDPDGDCIGSMLAIKLFLSGRGKAAACFAPGGLPEIYAKLPGTDSFLTEEALSSFDYDIIIALDTPTLTRTAGLARTCEECRIINIDHHQTNEGYGTINVIDGSAAAAAVLVYRLLEAIAPGEITGDIADCLYLGILMDTGGFRFQNTDTEALETAARLIELGARSHELAHEYIYMHKFSVLKLLALVLESLEVRCDGRVAVMEVTQGMLERNGGSMADTEGFVDYASSIDNVSLSALFREVGPHEIRVSLRSRDPFDVAELAGRYGGGGHRTAAGLTVQDSLQNAKARIIRDLEMLIGESS